MVDCGSWDGHGELVWELAPNEDGWRCFRCDAVLGFRPDLDRAYTFEKVQGILFEVHETKLIYVSNGTLGGIIAEGVARRCQAEDRYDQYSILEFILRDPNLARHVKFWQDKAREVASASR